MAAAEEFPFCGSVIWLTPSRAAAKPGRPFPLLSWPYDAATAFVPPHTAETGLASFVLRGFDAGAWRSRAEGRWLAAGTHDQVVKPGSVIVVTEGAQIVAYFTVQHITCP